MTGHLPAPIDHPYIDDQKVAERFVSGELTPDERASFERHYVDCPECMDRVALAQIFHVESYKPKPRPKTVSGIFTFLATFTSRQQTMIFAATALTLLLIPVFALSWLDSAKLASAVPEHVVWLPPSGSVEVQIPATASWITIAAAPNDLQATYRISIVDVADRPLITGPDQKVSMGTSIGLRVASLPSGVSFALVEKKADNGAYAIVSRHPLMIEWR